MTNIGSPDNSSLKVEAPYYVRSITYAKITHVPKKKKIKKEKINYTVCIHLDKKIVRERIGGGHHPYSCQWTALGRAAKANPSLPPPPWQTYSPYTLHSIHAIDFQPWKRERDWRKDSMGRVVGGQESVFHRPTAILLSFVPATLHTGNLLL